MGDVTHEEGTRAVIGMRCLCRAAMVKILGILAILAISLHIGYEQGPVVGMKGPAHRVATVLLPMRNAKTWWLPPGRVGESTVPCRRGVCKAPTFRPAYPQGAGIGVGNKYVLGSWRYYTPVFR